MKEPKRIDWIDCLGKRVTGVYEHERTLIVVFADGAHCIAEEWNDWDSGGMHINSQCDPLTSDLLRAGAIDQEWVDAKEEKRLERAKRESEERQAKKIAKKRAQLKRLKREFGEE